MYSLTLIVDGVEYEYLAPSTMTYQYLFLAPYRAISTTLELSLNSIKNCTNVGRKHQDEATDFKRIQKFGQRCALSTTKHYNYTLDFQHHTSI